MAYSLTNTFISLDPNAIYASLTLCKNYRAKTGNNVSKFMHSNWITIHSNLITVHYNLEYGLAIVTESFSPLDLNYTTSFVEVQTRSDVTSHAIPDTVYLACTLNWAKLV